MTLDAILNIFLISYFAVLLEILAVSNVGYVFADLHGVRPPSSFAALTADLALLIWLPNFWVPLAGRWCPINFGVLVEGQGLHYSGGFLGITGYGYGAGQDPHGPAGLAGRVVLYVWRHVVQDKIPLKWREQIPQTPEEERAHAELKAAATAAPAG